MPNESTNASLAALERAVLAHAHDANQHYLLAAELAQHHRYEEAIGAFNAALTLRPALHTARLQLGLLHLTMGHPQLALAVWEPLEALADEDPLKQFKLGLVALIRDEFDRCVSHLETGIRLNTGNLPLNRDMQSILAKVRLALSSGSAAGRDDAAAVRTDFSLYQ